MVGDNRFAAYGCCNVCGFRAECDDSTEHFPRCIHLRDRLYGVAETAHLVEYCIRRTVREFRGISRCGSSGSLVWPASSGLGIGVVPVDTPAFLELGDSL